MVSPVYLFIGQDSLSKDIRLKRLKEEFLAKEVEQFNLDTLYAKELNLKDLQEKLLCLPVKTKKRILLIRGAGELKQDIQEFLIRYVKKPEAQIILVLDINRQDPKDEFIKRIFRYCQVFHFKEAARIDAFTLSRQIDLKRVDYALRLLNQLLKNGEKPERILGGLRYSLEKNILNPLERKRRLRLLLNCDFNIKTGRLKPPFALEKLVVNLCCLDKPFG